MQFRFVLESHVLEYVPNGAVLCTKITEVNFICICLQTVSWRFAISTRRFGQLKAIFIETNADKLTSVVFVNQIIMYVLSPHPHGQSQ